MVSFTILRFRDVRAARVTDGIVRPSIQVSQYRQGITEDGTLLKLERFNPNGRIFKKGSTPFIGDYPDVAAPNFSLDADGNWQVFAEFAGDGPDMTTFAQSETLLPDSALHQTMVGRVHEALTVWHVSAGLRQNCG